MDTHHQNLFRIVNEIHAGMEYGMTEDEAERLLTELGDYCHYHFDEEEKLMERASFAGLAAEKCEFRGQGETEEITQVQAGLPARKTRLQFVDDVAENRIIPARETAKRTTLDGFSCRAGRLVCIENSIESN